jgi:hypothetical protein
MYIATMYSYGKDPACVGVDGIVTCMGVFLAYNYNLYAIHVPFNQTGVNDAGRKAFATYVGIENPHYKGKNAKLYVVTNGDSRGSARAEAQQYKETFKAGQATFITLRSKVGPDAAAAVLCEFYKGTGVIVKYQPHATAGWEIGDGVRRAGHYHNASFDSVYSKAGAEGWELANCHNSDLAILK